MKKEYDKKGYIILRHVLSEAQIRALEEESERLSSGNVKEADYYFEESDGKKIIRRIERVSLISPVMNSIFHDKKIMGALEELFGEPAYLFKDKFNLKLPGGGGFKPHLDGHFYWTDASGKTRKGWQEYSDLFINCVIPIEDVNLENGCLEVADIKYYYDLGKDFDEVTSRMEKGTPNVPASLMKDIPMVPLEMKKGDIAFFDWRCVHGSKDNHSKNSRKILYSTYNPKSSGNQYNHYFDDKESSQGSSAQKSLSS